MLPNRLHITKTASDNLIYLKGKTKLTPNVLARISLSLSLARGAEAPSLDFPLNGLEFNSTTLFGEYTNLYYHALLQATPNATEDEIIPLIAFHIENGANYLRGVKSISGLLSLLCEADLDVKSA